MEKWWEAFLLAASAVPGFAMIGRELNEYSHDLETTDTKKNLQSSAAGKCQSPTERPRSAVRLMSQTNT